MNRSVAIVLILCASITAVLFAQAPAQMPKPGADHKKLEAFVGSWTYEGEAKKNPFGPAGKITGTDVYEMLPGGFFLQHRWDEKNPLGNVKGTEIWGYNPLKKTYTYNYFSSLGEMGSGGITSMGNTWSFQGSGTTYDGKTASARGTLIFASPTSLMVKVEASPDGKTFTPAFEGKWTKTK